MELTYSRVGDYNIPDLIVPEESEVADRLVCGKYALLRKSYLKQHRRVLYTNLLTSGRLNAHLMEIERIAMSRMEQITAQMAAAQGVTEELKSSDQMKWVGLMNNIRHSAEESVLAELVYS